MHHESTQAATNASIMSASKEPEATVVNSSITNQCVSTCSSSTNPKASKLIVFPVTVYNKDLKRSQNVFAFVDSGSTCSYITDKLAKELKMTGKQTTLRMGTMNGIRDLPCQIIEGVQVSKLNGKETRDLPPMNTIARIPVDFGNIPRREDFAKYRHMDVLEDFNAFDGEIGLLLGNDVPFITKPLDISAGGEYEPFAMRTALGWIPHGFSCISYVAVTTLSIQKGEEAMQDLFQQVINSEFPERQVHERKENSQEDKRFLKIAASTLKRKPTARFK